MKFTVKLAGKRITMDSVYPELREFFKDYLDDGASDFTISWTKDDILAEAMRTEGQEFPMTYLETLVALRKLSEVFPAHQRFLMHGACIKYNEKAYIFTAPSGTGKSTHIRLWRKYLGDDVDIVNGDKPFLSVEDSQVLVYGTPWAGKERWQKNHHAPLHGICLLCRGEENRIHKIEPAEGLPFLLKQIYIPEDAAAAGLTLELLDGMLKNVPVYVLECNISEDAVQCSFEAMTGLPYPKTNEKIQQ